MPSMAPSDSVDDTDPPTLPPSNSPSMYPSQNPSVTPTSAPTTLPTPEPTRIIATPSPTSSPSTDPTQSPTTKEVLSTPSPSIEITEHPSNPPTNSATEADKAPENSSIIVEMPQIELSFALDDRDSGSDNLFDLEDSLESFIGDILTSQPGFEDYSEVSLQVVVAQLAGRRRLDIGLKIALTGEVTYKDESEAPSHDELTRILKAYFSFWGLEDLLVFMQGSLGFESMRGLTLSIDGSTFEVIGASNDSPFFPVNSETEAPNDSSDSGLDLPVIVGIIAGCTVVILLIVAGLAYNAKVESKKQLKKHEAYMGFDDAASLTGSSEKQEAPATLEAPEQMPPPPSSADDTPSDLSAVSSLSNPTFSMMSIESTSMLTSDLPSFITSHGDSTDKSNSSSDSYLQYDVNRLDKVIALAKQSSTTSEKKEELERKRLSI